MNVAKGDKAAVEDGWLPAQKGDVNATADRWARRRLQRATIRDGRRKNWSMCDSRRRETFQGPPNRDGGVTPLGMALAVYGQAGNNPEGCCRAGRTHREVGPTGQTALMMAGGATATREANQGAVEGRRKRSQCP